MRRYTIRRESWPLLEPFVIARFTQYTSEVIVVEIEEDGVAGIGECERPEAFEPNLPDTNAALEAARDVIEGGVDRLGLLEVMEPGPARAAVDCALWDLEAKRTGQAAWQLAGLSRPKALTTAYTLILDTPDAMAAAAARNADRPLLKLKLGGEGDIERVAAVRAAVPDARLIVDANEAWTADMLAPYMSKMAEFGIELVEQPLARGKDEALSEVEHPVPVCADESCHDRATLKDVVGLYDYINIKLDKTGGLTEALLLAEEAAAQGLGLMVGCMVGTSLAMAPAMLIGGLMERFVDLDGPLLLARDRNPGIEFEGSIMHPAPRAVWG